MEVINKPFLDPNDGVKISLKIASIPSNQAKSEPSDDETKRYS